MDQQKEQELLRLLQEYDLKKIPFVQSKKELLSRGHTEADIVYVLYSAPFDGKADVPRAPNPLQKMYEENPAKAQEVAKILLKDQERMDWDRIKSDSAAAALGPDIQSRSYYSVRAADELGVPYFTLLFGGVILAALAVEFKWTNTAGNIAIFIYQLIIIAIFAYKIVQKRRLMNKP